VLPGQKNEKHLAVDDLNNGIRQRRVIIHPRCRRLLEQLRTTLWNQRRSAWERTERDHGDLVDCLVYLWRHVFWHHDPRPPPPQLGEVWYGLPRDEGAEMAALARSMRGRR
jgi:hypothetical protein